MELLRVEWEKVDIHLKRSDLNEELCVFMSFFMKWTTKVDIFWTLRCQSGVNHRYFLTLKGFRVLGATVNMKEASLASFFSL